MVGKAVAKSIYKDPYGYEARAIANNITRIKRFPADTTIRAIQNWQEETRAAIRRENPVPTKGTFAADAARYLDRVQDMPSFVDRKLQIDWWVSKLGHKKRQSITTADIQDALDGMKARENVRGKWVEGTGKPAAATYNHYLTAIRHLYRTLDGKGKFNPASDIDQRRETLGAPRAIPEDLLTVILSHLPTTGSATVARVRVMAETGFSPAMIALLKPEDIDLINKCVQAPARHKGAGMHGRVLPLTDAAVVAMTEFVKANAFGAFSVASMRHAFHTACRKAGVTGIRLYDLRHTFLTRVLRMTNGNLEVTRAMAQHASRSTTERYTRAAVPEMLQHAIASLNVTVN